MFSISLKNIFIFQWVIWELFREYFNVEFDLENDGNPLIQGKRHMRGETRGEIFEYNKGVYFFMIVFKFQINTLAFAIYSLNPCSAFPTNLSKKNW